MHIQSHSLFLGFIQHILHWMAQNVLNALASSENEQRIVGDQLDLFAEYVLMLSDEDATAVYVE